MEFNILSQQNQQLTKVQTLLSPEMQNIHTWPQTKRFRIISTLGICTSPIDHCGFLRSGQLMQKNHQFGQPAGLGINVLRQSTYFAE